MVISDKIAKLIAERRQTLFSLIANGVEVAEHQALKDDIAKLNTAQLVQTIKVLQTLKSRRNT